MLQLYLIIALLSLVNALYSVLLHKTRDDCMGEFDHYHLNLDTCGPPLPIQHYTSANIAYGQGDNLRLTIYSKEAGNDSQCAVHIERGESAYECLHTEFSERIITGAKVTQPQANLWLSWVPQRIRPTSHGMLASGEFTDKSHHVSYGYNDGEIIYELVLGSEQSQHYHQLEDKHERIAYIKKHADRKTRITDLVHETGDGADL